MCRGVCRGVCAPSRASFDRQSVRPNWCMSSSPADPMRLARYYTLKPSPGAGLELPAAPRTALLRIRRRLLVQRPRAQLRTVVPGVQGQVRPLKPGPEGHHLHRDRCCKSLRFGGAVVRWYGGVPTTHVVTSTRVPSQLIAAASPNPKRCFGRRWGCCRCRSSQLGMPIFFFIFLDGFDATLAGGQAVPRCMGSPTASPAHPAPSGVLRG